MKKIDINPSTKVHDLLKSYPELEEKLINLAPPFKKFKNPILRKSIAKIATIKHISSVSEIPLNELINKLRKEVGQPPMQESYNDENYFTDQPDWFSLNKVTLSIQEDKLKKDDQMTVVTILQESRNIQKGEIIELITTFLPAPGIEILKSKGYLVWSKREENDIVKTYFLRNSD